MDTSLLPTPERPDLASLPLKDCHDLPTVIAAGLAHGLTPAKALDAAHWKWLTDHAEDVQRFGLANLYEDETGPRAMSNIVRQVRFLLVVVEEQQRQIAALSRVVGHELPEEHDHQHRHNGRSDVARDLAPLTSHFLPLSGVSKPDLAGIGSSQGISNG